MSAGLAVDYRFLLFSYLFDLLKRRGLVVSRGWLIASEPILSFLSCNAVGSMGIAWLCVFMGPECSSIYIEEHE
jgi:hypothetical protein